jgi:formylglycine-generating enzyme required for sulfatase activity
MVTMAMQSIGPFQLLEELGRGAMGVVFRGFDPAIGRHVAIKIIRADQLASPEEVSDLKVRFAREAAAAGKLSHPNIVTVYHLGEEGDLQYLVLELVNGASLEKTLSNHQPLDSKTAVSILTQVADALDYAHSEGIVHRDVKPANILVRPDGKSKITDFGIARIASQTFTRTGFTFGTPAYMSPEQILTPRVSGRADEYSLGVIAYQMLSGQKPFDADTGPSLMFQIMETQPPLLHAVNPAVPPRTSEVIAKAMAKKPEDRYPSCREFAKSLSESLNEARVGIRDPNREPAATMPTVRSLRSGLRLWIAASLAAVGVTVVGWVWWPVPAGPTGAPVLRPSDKKVNSVVTKVNPKDGLTYVWIPPGTFQMGCSEGDSDCSDDEKPAHLVTISEFWMARTEVTQAAYQRLMGTNPSFLKGPKLPVDTVDWDDARFYCKAAGMRLPTEAEWEYAARSGNSECRYGDLDAIAWYNRNSGSQTHEVGGKQANPWGLHDMLGNVSEWVADWYDQYSPGRATDPRGPTGGRMRALRGGAWDGGPRLARASYRLGAEPASHRSTVGFRCAGN